MFSSYHGSISVGLQDADHEVKNLYSRTFGHFGHPDFFIFFIQNSLRVVQPCLQCFDAVGLTAGRASGL